MCKHHLEVTTDICKQCIELQLRQYESNVEQNWKAKDVAIKLLLAVGIRSQSANGVSEVNPHINIMEIGSMKILPEIKDADVNSHPIIRAGCIKFVATLRNQFTKEQWLHMLPLLMAHFTSSNVSAISTPASGMLYLHQTVTCLMQVNISWRHAQAGRCSLISLSILSFFFYEIGCCGYVCCYFH